MDKSAYNADLTYDDIKVAVDAAQIHLEANDMSDAHIVSRLRSIENMLWHLETREDYARSERLVNDLHQWVTAQTGEDYSWVIEDISTRGY